MPRIRTYGHACFRLEQGDTQVLLDPFFTGNPHVNGVPADTMPATILVTHGHSDHLGDAIPIAKATGATILSTPEIGSYCAKQGAAVEAGHMGGTIKLNWGDVRFVPAFHSSSTGAGNDIYLGNPVGFVVRFFDTVFYHSGDTCLFGDMNLIGDRYRIDVAYLPIGGRYTMDIDDAVRAVQFLRPRVVIPGHFGTWPVIQADPEEFKAKVERKTTTQCVILNPGEAFEIS